MRSHPSDTELVNYAHHALNDALRETIDSHLTACPRCQAALTDHQTMQRRIQRSLQANLEAVHPSPQMTFAAIAPRLKRPHQVAPRGGQSRRFFSGATALAMLAVLVVMVVTLFGAISHPSGSAGPAVIPQAPQVAMGAVVTASIAVADNEQLRLMGYDLSAAQLAPGAMLTITLYWQTQHNLVRDYDVFIHVLDATGRLMASQDAPPAEGTRPTRSWRIGEPVTDSHTLMLPNLLTAGDYRLSVGLYDPTSGARLGEGVSLDRSITIVP
jgi:hypothetical protein